MKKTLITFSLASTLLVGGLAGCGADQAGPEVQNNNEPQKIGQTNHNNDRGSRTHGTNQLRTNNFRTNNFSIQEDQGGNAAADLEKAEKADTREDFIKDREYQGTFDDVPEGKWFTEYVEWAADAGLFEGVGNDKYAPDKEFTRAEAARVFARLQDMGVINLPDAEGNEAGEGGNEAGEGGNEAGEGGNEAGEGGNEAGEGGNEAGEGGNEAGEGGNEAGEGGNEAGEGVTPPEDAEDDGTVGGPTGEGTTGVGTETPDANE